MKIVAVHGEQKLRCASLATMSGNDVRQDKYWRKQLWSL